jgi:H+/gluconate symporter-like permease
MSRPVPPLYVPEGTYRRRRLVDAARLLPALAVLMFLLPMLWSPENGQPATRSTVTDGIYLFVVWALIIAAAAALGTVLRRPPPAPRGPEA